MWYAHKYYILFLFLGCIFYQLEAQPTLGLQNSVDRSYIGKYRLEKFASPNHVFFPTVGPRAFCRESTNNITTITWNDINGNHGSFILTQEHFLNASKQTGLFDGKQWIRDDYYLFHVANQITHQPFGKLTLSCDSSRSKYNSTFFQIAESPNWYSLFYSANELGTGEASYFNVDSIRFEIKMGENEWLPVLSADTNHIIQTAAEHKLSAHFRSMVCNDLNAYNMLRFKPQFFEDLADGNTYNIYQIRLILRYNCSLLDTLNYQFAVHQRITNIDYSVQQPCHSGVTDNGTVTLEFDDRTGGKYYKSNNSPSGSHTVRSDFDIKLYRDGTLNGIYDGCDEQTYTASGNTFTGLPAGDYRLEVKCVYNKFDYAYFYYDTITIHPLPSDFGFSDQYFICPSQTGVTLELPGNIEDIQWTSSCFSPGSNTQIKTFPKGTYVTATAKSVGKDCILKDTALIVDLSGFDRTVYKIDSVINISASEFSSNWPPAYMQMSWNTEADLYSFKSLPSYQKGSSGIYRPVHAYDYLDQRVQTREANLPKVNLKGDGVINDVKFFDWMYGADTSCLPGWILNATMTQYNSSGFDIENKDIFDIHSSALYGYRNQLPIAVSANAKTGEIGYEGFEEYTGISALHQLNNASGNIDLVPQSIAAVSERIQRYPILIGQGNYALLSLESFQQSDLCGDGWMNADVYIMIPDPLTGKVNDFTLSTRTKIVGASCDNDWMIIQFPEEIPNVFTPNECHHWRGELMLKEQVPMTGYQQLSYLSIADDKAHTGKRSLRVSPVPQSGEAPVRITSRQHKVQLEHGKKYHISAWIHHDEMNNYTSSALEGYNRDNGIGINVQSGENEFFFQPSGKVISGWQKISASFIHTGRDSYIDFLFTNEQEMYLDDIRIFPEDGNLQTYVYDPSDYRLRAVLDANNYATIYIYDAEGSVYAVKKETEEGILTLQQSNNYIKKNQP